MPKVDFIVDMRSLHRDLDDLARKQVPFATSLALNELARGVVDTEQYEMAKTFDSPTDFTMNSITFKPATKTRAIATIYPREIASHYLEPYVEGGNRSLWSRKKIKRGMIVPRDIAVNAQGNLTRGALARAKAKPNVFVGRIRMKSGRVISGVWERTAAKARPATKKRRRARRSGAIPHIAGNLKLLIQFDDSTPVPRKVPFYESAQAYLQANYEREFAAAMRTALATAR